VKEFVSKFWGPRQACSTLTSALLFAALFICAGATTVAAGENEDGSAPAPAKTQFLTAIAIPGNPIRSFDISWVNPHRAEYYLADRSNKGIDIVDTKHNTFKKTIGGFVGIKLNAAGTAVDNNHSGPDGVTSHGKWLYAGDGDSTLKVIDLESGTIVATLSTGGTTRLDEMALTTDGKLLLAVNNAEDPPFATLFTANGDDESNSVTVVTKIMADAAVIPAGAGLSIEQPTWDAAIDRFVASVPTIANNPTGCSYGSVNPGAPPCSGAVLIIDPTNLLAPVEKVVPLVHCGPNGATVGPNANVMFGCTPNNQPGDNETTVLNSNSFHYVDVGNLTGSDEVWYNKGSNRYYTGSSAMPGGAVLGVVDGTTNFLLQTIPQSSASHSVAADSFRNEIYVPQVAPKSVVGPGGDVTTVGAALCGSMNGCVAVFSEPPPKDQED
jgi:hypothetical protein